jgi:hypothetical protein
MERKGRSPVAFKSIVMGQMSIGKAGLRSGTRPVAEPATEQILKAPGSPRELSEAEEIERQELFAVALDSLDLLAKTDAMRILVERYPDGATLTFAGAHCADKEISLKAVGKLIEFRSMEGLAIVRAETSHQEVVERIQEFLIHGN